jgi:RNA polymerase sigma-70 factor (ECF subfamily)
MTQKEKIERQEILSTAHHDYGKRLNAHAFFKVNDHAIGEDLVQDTFMKTWKYLVSGGKIEAMKAFLYHILNNLIVDEYRKRKTTSLDVLLEKGFEPSFSNSEQLSAAFDGEAVLLLIEHLPPTYQKVIRMRYIQDLSLTEMSLITGQSKNTLAVQIHRGLVKLKLLYTDCSMPTRHGTKEAPRQNRHILVSLSSLKIVLA